VPGNLVKLIAASCALALLATGGATAPSRWQTFTAPTPGGGSFSVDFPQAPKYQSTPVVHMWSAQIDYDTALMVAVAIFPLDVSAAQARRVLEGSLKALAPRMENGKWANVDWKQHQGLLAFDAVGRTHTGRETRIYSVMKGTRVFSLTYVGLAGSAQSDDVNRFFASLKIQ
jgi:hypothetical protein